MTSQYATPCRRRTALAIVIAGMLGLTLAMGLGRFSYTTVFPLMQRDLGLSYGMGGWLAGVNLVGYMLGALICFAAPWAARSHKVAASMFILSITTTWCMGLTTNDTLWSLLRFISGLNSGVLFVYVSSEATERLIAHGRGNWAGAIYSGVGIGIVMTGVFTPLYDGMATVPDGWSAAWVGFGVLSLVVTATACILSLNSHGTAHFDQQNRQPPIPIHALHWLTAAYFFEALGYIVSATFLVTIIASQPQLSDLASWCWIIVGCSAIPATLIWTWLGRRIGTRPAMIAAYALQAAGIVVCVFANDLWDVIFVAVTFGGTFMGIVALSMGEGARRSPPNGRRIAAWLTAFYGIGQIIAPIIAGWLADLTHSFALPLSLAAGCVVIGIILILCDKYYTIPTAEISAQSTGD